MPTSNPQEVLMEGDLYVAIFNNKNDDDISEVTCSVHRIEPTEIIARCISIFIGRHIGVTTKSC